MSPTRLPRFIRSENAHSHELTARDVEIIRFIGRYRFARSTHIQSHLGGSAQQLLRRLQLLFHSAYLDRPRCQIDYFRTGGGSRPIVYCLGLRGEKLLAGNPASSAISQFKVSHPEVGRIFLDHSLLVTDVLSGIERGCKCQFEAKGNIRMIHLSHVEADDVPKVRSWQATLGHGRLIGVIPDGVFSLEWEDTNGNAQTCLFFLEADRGTMPVVRKNLDQSSFYRKLLAYKSTWEQSLHRQRWGFNRFRVITVTSSAARTKSLLTACAHLDRGRGLFLFTDAKTFAESPCPFQAMWTSPTSPQRVSLCD